MDAETVKYDSFINSLEYLVNAKSQDSTKGKFVTQWFADYYNVPGKASYIREQKQVQNRVTEQFKHGVEHIVFVCHVDVSLNGLAKQIFEYAYQELQSVLVVVSDNASLVPVNLLISSASDVSKYYEEQFPDIKKFELPKFEQPTSQLEVKESPAVYGEDDDITNIIILENFKDDEDIVTVVIESAELSLGSELIVLAKSLDFKVKAIWIVDSVEQQETSQKVKLRKAFRTNEVTVDELLESDFLDVSQKHVLKEKLGEISK